MKEIPRFDEEIQTPIEQIAFWATVTVGLAVVVAVFAGLAGYFLG